MTESGSVTDGGGVTDTGNTDNASYRAVFVRPGSGGWGKGLALEPTAARNKILSVTGGGIHPVAQCIAELTGGEAVDGFTTSVPDDQVLCAVINCGGTARIGVYPRKKIPTVDVYPGSPGGPLAQFITEELFVSAVGLDDIGGSEGADIPKQPSAPAEKGEPTVATPPEIPQGTGWFHRFSGIVVRFGSAVGGIVNTMLASGRKSIDLTVHTILPFMAYVSLLLGIVNYTGVAKGIGHVVSPIATSPLGLVAIGIITALPFLSPILGPGAAIAQIVGVLMGTQIAAGAIPVQYALPTLFAIDGQVGCDFVPVGLALGEAKPETVSVGVPAVLISRLITAPLAVLIAWAASFGL
ncbi:MULTISPECIES: PTS glucitol/sorbitol transporter subunit IIB [Streptomyces]|uniref:PTS glucitol/sorbitol transporter subunit IIB n=1 Tax=Streptomyces lycopersici TaxID=2974589 RepID=UPI0021CE0856|nr:PTS sorbitol transporter subunit IIB [Streptomyces sp. NEAU-383]